MKLTFRGEAGEVLLGFVHPLTLLTALPVMVLNALLLGVTAFFARKLELPPTASIPLLALSIAPVLGLFACAARRGKLDAGFLDSLASDALSHVPGFCLRFGLLAVAWGVPLALLAGQAAESLGALMGAALMGGLDPDAMGSGFIQGTWLVMSVIALAALAPALSLLIASRTDSVAEVFSGRAWSWILKERGDDLVPFFAAYVGGMMLFALGLVPVAVLAVPVAFDVSAAAGQIAVTLLPALPLAAAPILLGRLAGAFVAADFASEPSSEARAVPRPMAGSPSSPVGPAASRRRDSQREPTIAGRTEAGLAGLPIQATASGRAASSMAVDGTRAGSDLPLGVALARAHQRGETDPAAALADIDALQAQHSRNPALAGERARLLLRLGRDEEARAAAADAIRFALVGGAGPIAFDIFMAFAAHAPLLGLDAATHEQLARILLQRQELDGAAWCFRAVATLGGDLTVAQKGVLSVADAALRAGQQDAAAEHYEGFLRTWPDSPFQSFAVDGLDKARRRHPASVR